MKQVAIILLTLVSVGSAPSETLSLLASRNLSGDVSRLLGVGQLAAKVRNNLVSVILIDLGGALSASEQSFEHRRKGSLTVDLMNQSGYAGWLLAGRDLGWSNQLTKFLRRADFPVLAANLYRAETGRHLFQVQPYTVIRTPKRRIGLIGLVGSTADIISSDPVAAADYYSGIIADACDLLVVVSSAGPGVDAAIAKNVSQVDLVIGEGPGSEALRTEGGWIVSVENAQGLWGIDLTIVDGELREAVVASVVIPVVDRESVSQAFMGWSAELEGEPVSLDTVIGFSEGGFKAALTSPFGYLVADLIRASAATDCALVRADHFLSDFVTGEISVYDLYRAYPQSFTVGVGNIKGEELQRLLTLKGDNLLFYPSGIDAVYSEGEGGLVQYTVGEVSIDPLVDYTVAFELGAPSDAAFSGSRVRDTGERVRDLIGQHVRTSATIKGVVDGRIEKR